MPRHMSLTSSRSASMSYLACGTDHAYRHTGTRAHGRDQMSSPSRKSSYDVSIAVHALECTVDTYVWSINGSHCAR
jgi:hypothetical protein